MRVKSSVGQIMSTWYITINDSGDWRAIGKKPKESCWKEGPKGAKGDS